MSDEIWEAFQTTPAPIEPVKPKTDDLHHFQRRLLEQCGWKLEEAQQRLAYAYERMTILEHMVEAAESIIAEAHHAGLDTQEVGEWLVNYGEFRDA